MKVLPSSEDKKEEVEGEFEYIDWPSSKEVLKKSQDIGANI